MKLKRFIKQKNKYMLTGHSNMQYKQGKNPGDGTCIDSSLEEILK